MKVKIVKRHDAAVIPNYATAGSAGMDLVSIESVAIPAGGRRLINTGISIELPVGLEAQIRPKSGRALKEGLTVLNSPGTIDSDYRGEVKVLIHNTSNVGQNVFKGEKIAQMVIAKYEVVEWDDGAELSETLRGEGGFGSTGL